MFHRRNSSDNAIGWISTVDSLLLGFGLMLVLALHSAMTLRDGKGTDVRMVQSLEQREKTLEKLVAENAEQLAGVSKDLDGTKKLLADSNNKVKETCRERDALKKEVDDTKTYLTGAYPLRFDGNKRIASILVGMQMLGLPVTYPAERNAKVDAVTLEDVNRVAAALLTPDKLTFVVVGDAVGVVSGN